MSISDTPSRTTRHGRLLKALPFLALLTYLACLFSTAQYVPEGLLERDGYYHARVAQMLPQRGLSRSFPWTQQSTWKDRYCDKELLYHLMLVPFTLDREDPIAGAQVFTILLDLGIVVALFMLLRSHGARLPLLFTALLICMGGMFLVRLTMVRAHVLSILLALGAVHLLLGRRWKHLAVLGLIYAWSYSVPFVLVLIAGPFVLGRWLAGGGLDWRSLLATIVGVVCGLIVHPYTPHTLETFYTYLQVIYLGASGGPLSWFMIGREIYPLTTRSFLITYPLLTMAPLALCIVGWRIGRRLSPEAMGALCVSLFWLLMAMLFGRLVEYAAPMTVVALALVTRDAWTGEAIPVTTMLRRPKGRLLLAAVSVLLVILHLHSVHGFVAQISKAPPLRFKHAAAWMKKHLRPQETVMNLHWGDFPDLFYHGSRQRYLWGLDPTYTIRFNREIAILLERIRQGRMPIDGKKLSEAFGTRYMILRREWVPSYRSLLRGDVKLVYIDQHAAIFDLQQRGKPLWSEIS